MESEQPTSEKRRFTVEELDNGYLVKISKPGTDKLIGRHAYVTLDETFDFIRKEIQK